MLNDSDVKVEKWYEELEVLMGKMKKRKKVMGECEIVGLKRKKLDGDYV